MHTTRKRTRLYILISIGIFLAAALRFWGISEPGELVFDEVFFPVFAFNYLTGQYFFDVHPPLAKYMIAAGMWTYESLTDSIQMVTTEEVSQLPAASYRWVNALVGTLMCLTVARLAFLLSRDLALSLLCGLLIAIDGAFIVESRLGLNNIYTAYFGVLSFLFLARYETSGRRVLWLALTGVSLGCALATKWSALGFAAGIWALALLPAVESLIAAARAPTRHYTIGHVKSWTLTGIQRLCLLLIVPAIVYVIIWIPHLLVFEGDRFAPLHQAMYQVHSDVKVDAHPNCSPWYEWPLTLRTIPYYYQVLPATSSSAVPFAIDIRHLGNAAIYLLSTAAIVTMFFSWIRQLYRRLRTGLPLAPLNYQSFTILGFCATWLPWSLISRCTFQYHYLPSSAFAFMALAYYLIAAIRSPRAVARRAAWTAVSLILLVFFIRLPWYLGIPLPAGNILRPSHTILPQW